MLQFQTEKERERERERGGNREMSGGAVRNVLPLHPSLLSCNREELYGKLLRAEGGGSGPEIQINGIGRGGEDCFLLRNEIPCTAPTEN